MSTFSFQVLHNSPQGRLGRLTTPHGIIETPAFLFCATKASLKGLSVDQIKAAGTSIILSNTYHLMLQPGADRIAALGGIHRFTGWDGPIFTDSGGFQIFSLGHGSVAQEIKGCRSNLRSQSLIRVSEEGAIFKSYLNGDIIKLTPEKSIQIQRSLGADLIAVLDECTPFHINKSATEHSMSLSHRWAQRSLNEFQKAPPHTQALYGIIQGGVYEDLRQISAEFINEHPFFGHAIGGSLGATKPQMHEVIAMTVPHLNPSRPVHLLGIGGISDIFYGITQGIDTFDCVHPTRIARHGGALTKRCEKREHINLTNACFRSDPQPIDDTCPCYTCQTYSRAYLHHLFKTKELLAFSATTLHNVTFMNRLMSEIRRGLLENNLHAVKQEWTCPR